MTCSSDKVCVLQCLAIMAIRSVQVRSAAGAYRVLYGRGLLARAAAEIKALGPHTGVFLLTSPRVARHWRGELEAGLGDTNRRATLLFDDRERAKNMATVEKLCRGLVRAGADRRAVIVAAGGGVVGDVAGFVAATYLRGVRMVHIPTTLVAQVDSAIGGKTGVNLPEGKNLVGAFYPGRVVLADPATLATLPRREFRSGLYEVIKYGVICDRRLFEFLEENIERVAARERAALDFAILRCIQAKADVVSRDERESGLREILNFGHTFAHAFETATNYRTYLHGEAVGWGMIAAARLAERAGLLAAALAGRIEALVRRAGALPAAPRQKPGQLIVIMRSDKKTRGGKLRFVLPDRIGHVATVSGISHTLVRTVLANLAGADPAS
jgi:3-dehydroquinate synthase